VCAVRRPAVFGFRWRRYVHHMLTVAVEDIEVDVDKGRLDLEECRLVVATRRKGPAGPLGVEGVVDHMPHIAEWEDAAPGHRRHEQERMLELELIPE
jgi:hypothetical protein